MSKQYLKKFLNDHHLKLWACAFGIIVAMSLAAATPSLTKNSVAAGGLRPTTVKTHGFNGSLIYQASDTSASPSPVPVQGTAQTIPADQDEPVTVPAPYTDGYKCPMMEGAQSDSNICGHYCTDSVYPCGCYGRGAELMCAMP